MRSLLLSLLALAIGGGQVLAQASDAELPFMARQMGLGLAVPSLENLRFDTTRVSFNRCDLRMRWFNRREGFEVYAQLVPEPDNGSGLYPHILGGTAIVNAALNSPEDQHFIARYRAGDDDLARLNADWATFWAFTPKPEFSGRKYGYQATYHKEGQGVVHVWVLADKREVVNGEWAYVLPFAAQGIPQ